MKVTSRFLWRVIFAITELFPVNGYELTLASSKELSSNSGNHSRFSSPAKYPNNSFKAEFELKEKDSTQVGRPFSKSFVDTQLLHIFGNEELVTVSDANLTFEAEFQRRIRGSLLPSYSNPRIKNFARPSKDVNLSVALPDANYSTELSITPGRPHTKSPISNSKTMNVLPLNRHISTEIGNLRGSQVLIRKHEENSNRAKDESLELLLTEVIEKYLKECDLILAADETYQESSIVALLVRSSNIKQVIFMKNPEDIHLQVHWTTYECHGTLILTSDPRLLIELGNDRPSLWDYRARVVIVGQTEEILNEFTETKIGRKTEHIVGIVQDGMEGRFKIFMNQMFWGEGMTQVTRWYGTGFRNRDDLFPDKISNLRKGVVRVIVFEWRPAIIYHRDKDGTVLFRYGRDPAVVEALAQILNFTVLYKDPPDGQTFGLKLPNGSYDGMVGLMGSHGGDISIANLYMSAIGGRDQFQEYSSLFAEDKSCYMARVDPPLPRWQSPGLPFQMDTWIAILVGLLLMGPVLYALAYASKKSGFEESGYRYIILSSLYTFGVHFSHPMKTLPKGSGVKLFVAFFWVYSILLTTGYRSNLTAFLTVIRQPSSIETFKDLYESGLWVMGIPFFRTSLQSSGNQYLQALVDKYQVRLSFAETTKDVLRGKAVTINSLIYLEAAGARMKRRGKPMVRIMKECLSSYPVGLAYPKNSPLKTKFDLWIGRLFDSGLVRRWLLDSITLSNKLQKTELPTGEVPEDEAESAGGATPLSMDHMQGVFIVLGFGYALSTIVFSIEMFGSKA